MGSLDIPECACVREVEIGWHGWLPNLPHPLQNEKSKMPWLWQAADHCGTALHLAGAFWGQGPQSLEADLSEEIIRIYLQGLGISPHSPTISKQQGTLSQIRMDGAQL